MKRLSLILVAIMMLGALLTACVEDPLNKAPTVPTENVEEIQNAVKDTDFDDSIEGIYKYMCALKLMDECSPVSADADIKAAALSLIGAKNGNKYSYRYNGNTVVIELYSFDPDNLNETAEQIIESVKTTGKFEVLDFGEVDAVLSDSGKYLLVYGDASVKSNKPNEANVQRMNQFIEKFRAFKAQ